jgi:hypothetical protein
MSNRQHGPEIVFTFLGGKMPRYALQNLLLIEQWLPQSQITLVSDVDQHLPAKSRAKFVQVEPLTESWEFVSNNLDHPKLFRRNFWFYTIARFYALASYMEIQDSPILHVECDVLLLPNFPIQEFANIDTELAFSIVSQDSASAAILFLKNREAARTLVRLSEQLIAQDGNLTDMTILKRIYDQGLMTVTRLPSYPHEEESESLFSKSIFDPATWGMYYLGLDPRNSRGFSRYAQSPNNHQIYPSNYELKLQGSSLIITCRYCAGDWILFSLHVHSKDIEVFNKASSFHYLHKRIEKAQQGSYLEFKPKIFLGLSVEKVFRRLRKVFKS